MKTTSSGMARNQNLLCVLDNIREIGEVDQNHKKDYLMQKIVKMAVFF
jgi:hypothetical protein